MVHTRLRHRPLGLAFSLIMMAALVVLVLAAIRLLMASSYQQISSAQNAVVQIAPPLPGLILPHLLPTAGNLSLLQANQALIAAPTATNTPVSTAIPTEIPTTEAASQVGAETIVLLPTPTMTPEPAIVTAPATDMASIAPLQPAITLTGFQHAWQTWNNCGPATLSMNLSYYGATLNQADIGAVLRRFPDDKNVSPHELVDFAHQQGYLAHVRADGSTALAKTFLANGIPILIETWLEPEPNDGMGHYRLLTGYDESTQRWIAYDSYVSESPVAANSGSYAGIYLDMAETDRLWHVFNYTYVVVYTEAQEALVASILGAAIEPTTMWSQTLARAQVAVERAPDDPFAWFNLGTSLVQQGAFGDAALAYDRARAIGLPWRMFWYQFEPLAAYHGVGRYGDVIQIADTTLAIAGGIEELHYWKGQALHARNDLASAKQAWQYALQLNPDFTLAAAALNAVQ